jgi:hypothetical protein
LEDLVEDGEMAVECSDFVAKTRTLLLEMLESLLDPPGVSEDAVFLATCGALERGGLERRSGHGGN